MPPSHSFSSAAQPPPRARPPTSVAERLYGTTASLKIPPGSALEALRDDRKGQHSMRIHQQWRVCFVWTPEGAANVELVDYRDGRHRPSAVPLLRPE
jgi:proteic killer suppression protein